MYSVSLMVCKQTVKLTVSASLNVLAANQTLCVTLDKPGEKINECKNFGSYSFYGKRTH